ncbi:MAG: hypothetical protein JRI25_00295 [Deltaproteobacteria bacterium]|nr:hypothetical protein [Deltaproteobacteria bacterium]MBW2253017.1 hypothetical protein [Deltaproteobacteria bacterium]
MRRLLAWVSLGAILMMSCSTHAHPPDLQRTLRKSWTEYLEHFVQRDGRVIDRSDDAVTTSEGQAYAMLRAVWLDDRQTFDTVRGWTVTNLQGGDPTALSAWRWGRGPDDVWAVIDPMPASDADQLMAYALLIAAKRWKDPAYRHTAVGLIARIWEEETLVVSEGRVMLPGPWAKRSNPIRVNPSYLMPFVYREFAKADPRHSWMDLVTMSYQILDATVDTYGLPPDWCYLDAETGSLVPPPVGEEKRLHFGYEALRVPWNLAVDVQWYDDGRARVLLARMAHLGSTWRRTGRIPSIIAPGGAVVSDDEYVGLYGALLPAWYHSRPDDVDRLYAEEVDPRRSRTGWGREDDYYGQNWVWFGLALWGRLAVPPEAL